MPNFSYPRHLCTRVTLQCQCPGSRPSAWNILFANYVRWIFCVARWGLEVAQRHFCRSFKASSVFVNYLAIFTGMTSCGVCGWCLDFRGSVWKLVKVNYCVTYCWKLTFLLYFTHYFDDSWNSPRFHADFASLNKWISYYVSPPRR